MKVDRTLRGRPSFAYEMCGSEGSAHGVCGLQKAPHAECAVYLQENTVGHSLTLLTAALLVGQTPVFEFGGRNNNCPCKNGQQGRVLAQPEMATETHSTGWWNGRSSTTMTTETYSSGVQQTGWADNRPVLSRIRNLFN